MKILFFLSAFPYPIDDGIKKIVDNIIREAVKEGHQISLVVPKSQEKLDYSKSVEIVHYQKRRSPFSLFKDLIKLQPLYFSLYYDKAIADKIDKSSFDIIFYDFYPMTQYSSGLKKELFMMPDSMKTLALGTARNSEKILEKVYHYVNYFLACIYNRKIKNLKKLYVSNEDVSIDNLPNSYFLKIPADEMDFSKYWETPKNKEEISFRGVMSFEPNVTAITSFYDEIFTKLVEKYPNQTLKIIGKDPSPKLKRLSKNTEITGFVDDPLLEMSKSFVHIVPMISGSGVKTKLLDSMALKRLVFATPKAIHGIFSSVKEAEENGVIVYSSVDEFFVKFEKLQNFEIDYEKSVERAYSFIRNSSYKKLIEELVKIKEY